jgi:chaperonin GroEL (HSP60 family)
MKNGVLGKVAEVDVAAVQLGGGVEQVKEVVADALEDGVKAAKRAVKQGRHAAIPKRRLLHSRSLFFSITRFL